MLEPAWKEGVMIGFGAAPAAAVGAVGTVVAVILLPWAQYGGIDVGVGRLPNGGLHVSTVVLLHLCVAWALVARARRTHGWHLWLPRVIGLVSGMASAGSTVVVLSRFDDAVAIFGPVIPPIKPVLGLGGPVAVTAILISAGAIAIQIRRPETADRE